MGIHINHKLYRRGFLLSTLLFSFSAQAMPEQEYLRALKIAEKKVEKQQSAARSSLHALSSAVGSGNPAFSAGMFSTLFGRRYQVGDQWDVAAWQLDHGMMRMVG